MSTTLVPDRPTANAAVHTAVPGDLLTRMERVQQALRRVRVGRRVLVASAAGLVVFVLLRLLSVYLAGAGQLAGGRVWWVPAMAALAAGLAAWWWGRVPPPDLSRTALWVEERHAQVHGGGPDFALTTAVELLTQRAAVPALLSVAAEQTLRAAPLRDGLARERRAAWVGPAVFVLCCTLIIWFDVRTTGVRNEAVRAGALPAGMAPATAPAVPAPIGAWRVRVQPPAYAALPLQQYGDVNTVPALSGSTIDVRGTGDVPFVAVTAVDSAARPRAVVGRADGTGGWQAAVSATSGAQTVRLERGGRARLLIVEGRPDSVPRVSLDAPARDSVFREPRGTLPLAAVAHDDIGLTRAHFELIVTSGEGERFTVRTVVMGEQRWNGRAGTRDARLRGQLDLGALGLQAGDVVHLRAVARDAHPDSAREFGSSETRAFRIARPSEYDSVAVEPAPPPDVDKSLLSQRMLLMLTEKLDKAQRRMARPDVLREAQKIARDQARLRLAVGDVVFQRLSGESTAEHAHSAGDGHDHGVDLQGGKLSLNTSSTTGMLEEGNDSPVIAINQPLLEAYNAMWDAGRALEQGDPHGAIPPMQRALEAIERSRAASRLYLRGRPPQVIVDIAKVRLTGKDTGQVTNRSARAALPARAAERDARLVRAATLAGIPAQTQAARDSVAVLRVEALGDAPAFAAALNAVLSAFDRGGDVTASFVQARRVLGNVTRTRAAAWSRGGTP